MNIPMNMRTSSYLFSFISMVTLSGCGESPAKSEAIGAMPGLSFAEWKESVRFRPGKDVFAVGDKVSPIALLGDSEARYYYDRYVSNPGALTIHNGQRGPNDWYGAPWQGSAFPAGATLKYCIDAAALRQVKANFGLPASTNLYDYVDTAFGAAAAAWNEATGTTYTGSGIQQNGILIVKDAGRDESCSPQAGDDITWYVKPYGATQVDYLVFALHPILNAQAPENREFLVLDYLIQRFAPGGYVAPGDPGWNSILSLEGLMLRGIAMGLGFVGEENRGGVPGDSGEAYWDSSCRDPEIGGIFMTEADPFSVMTHPSSMASLLAKPDCAGFRDRDYALTYLDAAGASCQYRAYPYERLYFCSASTQEKIAATVAPDCSPTPLLSGGAGDCGTTTSWDDPKSIADGAAAIIEALL